MTEYEATHRRMTFAVAPPEYFPGLELAALALSVDVLVVADTFQYVRQSRHNRARLRTPTGSQWITVPIESGQFGRSVHAVRIDGVSDWRRVHAKALRFNYGGSAYYSHFVERVTGVMESRASTLGEVTVPSLRCVLELLGCRARVLAASDMAGTPGRVEAIRQRFPGCTPILTSAQADREASQGGEAQVLSLAPFTYRQAFAGFVPGLSVLDLVMNHGPESAEMLAAHTRLEEPA